MTKCDFWKTNTNTIVLGNGRYEAVTNKHYRHYTQVQYKEKETKTANRIGGCNMDKKKKQKTTKNNTEEWLVSVFFNVKV